MVVAMALVGAIYISAGTLTYLGQHKRGSGAVRSFAAGLLFPVTWIVWYCVDEKFDLMEKRAVRRH